MTSIDHFNLRSFDLNLLLAFHAMMQERSVTRAAARLRVQQPSMSHALSTLRMLLQDDLFVRAPRGLDPTPRATQLAPGVHRLLADAQALLLAPSAFDPATDVRTFRIGMSDQLEVALLPDLLERCRRHAPGVRLLVRATDQQHMRDMVEDGRIDMAIGYYESDAVWLRRTVLFDETHVCVFHPDRLTLPAPLDLETYCATPHVAVSSRNDLDGYMEKAFARAGVRRNTVMATPHFSTLAFVVSQTPVVATLPERAARRYADALGLGVRALPFLLDPFPVALLWHLRADSDPALLWLRRQVSDAAGCGH